MARSINHGKRGSNAGDEFHELWALRRALETISRRSSVQYITVEGIAPEDGVDPDGPEWDGVDCAIYHGAAPDAINRIEIVQVKYSPSAPKSPWTTARFTYSPGGKKRNSSVAARLGEAYLGVAKDYPDLAARGAISVKLVSNQPVSSELADVNEPHRDPDLVAAIGGATKLTGADLAAFLSALDFSECGSVGRQGLEEQFIKDIAAWDAVDTAQQVLKFREFIRGRMRPEGHGRVIDTETILAIFNSANIRTLFPCRPAFEHVDAVIPRAVSDEILALWQRGEQRVCLHGQGGEGKTTILADIAARLSENSILIAFDCYGGGSYLNSNAYRHKPQDAFVQLSNDCASALMLPLLLTQNRDADHPRLFMERVEQTAAAFAAVHPEALLVVAVDAADNALAAARDAADGTPSFVPAFLKLGDPPANVRFLVSARTGRIGELSLPASYRTVHVGPFSPGDTKTFVERALGPQPAAWHAQVHSLTGGNPRVLKYALDAAGGDPAQFVDYLAPHGKDLSAIFTSILKEAFKKAGAEEDVRRLCAALALLPRPIPVEALAAVSGHPVAHVRDILSDLRPGVIVNDDRAGFRDEDFEQHVRETGGAVSADMLQSAADFFVQGAAENPYCAEHASTILARAGRNAELLVLARQDINEYPVGDPAVRTIIHETRMRAALRVCRTSGDVEAAMKLLLAGADAFRRDAAIRRLLFDNIDLSAHFSRDQMRQIFLGDPDNRPQHGSFLMHAIAAGSGEDDPTAIALAERLLAAWFGSHSDQMASVGDGDGDMDDWELKPDDLAAYAVARMEVDGVKAGIDWIRRARPAAFRARILRTTCERLARSGKYALLEAAIGFLPRRYPRLGLAQVLLALGGRPFDLDQLVNELVRLQPRLARIVQSSSDIYTPSSDLLDMLDLVMAGIEIALIHGASRVRLKPILAALSPGEHLDPSRMNRSASAANNVAIRAAVLLRTIDRRKARAEDIVTVPRIEGRSKDAQKQRRERDADVAKAVKALAALISTYKIRSDAILGRIPPARIAKEIGKGVLALRAPSYRQDEDFEQRGRQYYLGRSLLVLAAVPGVKAGAILDLAIQIEGGGYPASEIASELLRQTQFIPGAAKSIPAKIDDICSEWRHAKLPGTDKIELITRYSRIALLQSPVVARKAFNFAVEIASEIDAESVQALAVCHPLARRSREAMSCDRPRDAALKLAAIAKDVGERVGSGDNFPWHDIMAALACLDLPLALATCARYDDIGLERLANLIDPLLEEGLRSKALSVAAGIALLPLAGPPGRKVVTALAARGVEQDSAALDYLARDLLCLRADGVDKIVAPLDLDHAPQLGPWASALRATAAFVPTLKLGERATPPPPGHAKRGKYNPDFDWSVIQSPDDFVNAIDTARDAAPTDLHVPVYELVNQAIDAVPTGRRTDALAYVAERPESFGYGYHLGGFLRSRLDLWAGDAAVARWQRENLPAVIADKLDIFARYIEMGQSDLPYLLGLMNAPEEKVIDCLLAGVERRIDELSAGQIYLLAGQLADYAPAAAAAAALEEHLARRLERLDPEDRSLENMPDVPEAVNAAVARFIFASMGSTSAPRRWLAAHAGRRLAGLGETGILDLLIACYGRSGEHSFAHPVAPFGILNAKLWLMMALARAASEAADVMAPHRNFLFEAGASTVFPHVLIRAFAQQALQALAIARPPLFAPGDLDRIANINRSKLPRGKRPKTHPSTIFDRHGFYKTKRRFSFDSMDTLPYVFEDAVRGFSAPSEADFLDRAEHWILDVWKAPAKPYEVDKLRHAGHWRDRDGLSSSASHGALPSSERYQTYLEYHAMYCAVGELLVTHPLRPETDDGWDSFAEWLRRRGLRAPPFWISDYRGPKPLEVAFWARPTGEPAWLDTRAPDEVRCELALDDSAWIVLAADHWSSDEGLRSTVTIESCLVSSATASALRHAVEAQTNAYGYRLAIRLDDEIDQGAFQLKAILEDVESDRGIDTHDRFSGDLDGLTIAPRGWVLDRLGLVAARSRAPAWVDSAGLEAIRVIGWSDEAHYGDTPSYRYQSHGIRLAFRRDIVGKLLEELGLDLAVELKMQRTLGERYGRRNQDKEQQTEYDRLIILRRDGTIEASDGPLGHWRAH